MSAEDIDRLRLARAEGVGPITYRRLLDRFGDATAALAALPGLARSGGRATPPGIPTLDAARREIERLGKLGARLLFLGQPLYPPLLALLDDAPPAIAVQGKVAATSMRAVAIVGSRNASANGQRMAEMLAQELARAGVAVVSGMARGIDAAAHKGALAGGGVTLACVAGGIDQPYPPENADLQDRIVAEGGAVLAEAPLGTAPQARHFPRRNRIIAGLSLGVVVVEAAMRSGSLVTARLAHDANRELFAVPGSPLDPRCHGPNDLIKQGAHLTETAADILENLPDHPERQGLSRSPLFARGAPPGLAEPAAGALLTAPAAPAEIDRARTALLTLLGLAPTPIDDLIRHCQFSVPAVMGALLVLELAGRIESLPGGRVALLAEPRLAAVR